LVELIYTPSAKLLYRIENKNAKLPVILNRSELKELFAAPKLLKHRIALTLALNHQKPTVSAYPGGGS